MPNNFNLSPSMPVWNERVSASPNGLLDQIRRRRAEYGAAPYKDKPDGLISLSKAPPSLDIPKMYQDPNAAKYGFVNNSQAAQYKPGLVQPSANAGLINGMTPQNIKEREAYQQQMAAGERSMFEPPQGLVPEVEETPSGLLVSLLGDLEGVEAGEDIRGIWTEAYGVVNDITKKRATTLNNEAIARRLYPNFTTLGALTREQLKGVAAGVFQQADTELSQYTDPETGENTYNQLSPKYKALALDAKFNSNDIYKNLMKASLNHMYNPDEDNLAAITKESRRRVRHGGNLVNHYGMDARVKTLLGGLNIETIMPSGESLLGADTTRLMTRPAGSTHSYLGAGSDVARPTGLGMGRR